MKHAPNMTDHTISRGSCSLRTHRPALIGVSTWQKSMAPGKHHAYHQNAGQADTAMSAKGVVERHPQINPRVGSTYKSP